MVTELQPATTSLDRIEELLGANARTLLDHTSLGIPKDQINLPGPDFIDRVWTHSDRSPAALRSLQSLFDKGRLAGTGYLPFCRWTRGSSIPREHRLLRIRNTSILKTS